MVAVGSLAALIVVQRLTELVVAGRNRKYLQGAGGKEYGAAHYPLFFALHVGWLCGWTYEALAGGQISNGWYWWLGLFLLAQGLRYWCMISLGPCWNTRILVIPGQSRVKRGPYRFIAHPNYLAVAIELACVPLVFNAFATAAVASLCNALLLFAVRLPAEKKALQLLH